MNGGSSVNDFNNVNSVNSSNIVNTNSVNSVIVISLQRGATSTSDAIFPFSLFLLDDCPESR